METLNIKYKDKNIAEVLDMRVSEALEFFDNIPKIKNIKTAVVECDILSENLADKLQKENLFFFQKSEFFFMFPCFIH